MATLVAGCRDIAHRALEHLIQRIEATPALEEPFAKRYPPTKDGPRVAVEGVEIEGGGRRIVLFTTEEINLQDANRLLNEEGFHGVMRATYRRTLRRYSR